MVLKYIYILLKTEQNVEKKLHSKNCKTKIQTFNKVK